MVSTLKLRKNELMYNWNDVLDFLKNPNATFTNTPYLSNTSDLGYVDYLQSNIVKY